MFTYVIILIAVVVVGLPIIFLVNKQPKLRIPFQLIFAVVIVILAALLFKNINKPIKFEREVKKRSAATIERLKDIRTIQVSYKDKYGKYTASFDTLIAFVKSDSLEIENIREVVPGSWKQDEMSKKKALAKGLLVKSASYVYVSDSLWKDDKTYNISDIRYAPYTDKKEYNMGASELETGSGVKVKVFESYILYSDLFKGLDKQLIVNYIDEKTKYGGFEGIRVGSLTETNNNAGNWEQ